MVETVLLSDPIMAPAAPAPAPTISAAQPEKKRGAVRATPINTGFFKFFTILITATTPILNMPKALSYKL